jgi:hypothetical protein
MEIRGIADMALSLITTWTHIGCKQFNFYGHGVIRQIFSPATGKVAGELSHPLLE